MNYSESLKEYKEGLAKVQDLYDKGIIDFNQWAAITRKYVNAYKPSFATFQISK